MLPVLSVVSKGVREAPPSPVFKGATPNELTEPTRPKPLNPAPPSPKETLSTPSGRPAAFPAESLNRLARLVLDGDVVFFVGAGFSLDSEPNTSTRLIKRLLIRLQAFHEHLHPLIPDLNSDLRATFELGPTAPELAGSSLPCTAQPQALFPYAPSDIRELSRRYYETNDWFCKTFGRCLEVLAQQPFPQRETTLQAIARSEEHIRTHPGGSHTEPLDTVPLDLTTIRHLAEWLAPPPPISQARRFSAGKALFLATMGFADPQIMAGNPTASDLDQVALSYRQRLKPRHHILAQFARDGLCTTTITTNFDLLLEGAFRLAGFHDHHTRSTSSDPIPPTRFSNYARIASPESFLKDGKAHRTPVLVKMHGCASLFKEALPRGTPKDPFTDPLEHSLRTMVFTYREIQNWRDDAWAADYLRTLLRTRTVVFIGYSLQDPVIHDTFRNVYEEMARVPRSPNRVVLQTPRNAEKAPAFFLDRIDTRPPGRKPFHAGEVLNAASEAVGVPHLSSEPHPNFIPFHTRDSQGFPNLDEVCQWLYHLVLRYRQHECLHGDLQRTLTALYGRARPESELNRARQAFDALFQSENRLANTWANRKSEPHADSACRRQMERASSWSRYFHVGLLRELAIVDHLRRSGGLSLEFTQYQRLGWYYPIMEDAGWTCWTAIIELALRRMIAATYPKASLATRDPAQFWAAATDHPTLLFLHPGADGNQSNLHALSIRFSNQHQCDPALDAFHQPVRISIWLLRDLDAPWRASEWTSQLDKNYNPSRVLVDGDPEDWERLAPGTQVRRAPPAHILWRWASRTETQKDRDNVDHWLGILRAPSAKASP